MKYGSVCSGIEAATVAWHPLKWQPQFFSEIEKFPCKVLQHHFPSVPNYGDMTKFKEWPDAGIDLLVGGTPCQAFSVAGLRQGLADPRGNLALVYLGVVDKYRPRWVVWENVPGVLSSNGGRDFGAYLGALGELGYQWAYRVLDAQYFGVPQRRRRVFVVGHLGDWRRAAAVLFEREGVRGDTATGRGARSQVARTVALGAGECVDTETVGTLTTNASQSGCRLTGQLHATLDAKKGSRRQEGVIVGTMSSSGATGRKHGFGWGQQDWESGYIQPVAQSVDLQNTALGGDVVGTLDTTRPSRGGGQAVLTDVVRRLTPRECERLQGFPGDWTAIPNASDSARYKAIGNSMAVPCMRWIGEGIAEVDTL